MLYVPVVRSRFRVKHITPLYVYPSACEQARSYLVSPQPKSDELFVVLHNQGDFAPAGGNQVEGPQHIAACTTQVPRRLVKHDEL